MPREASESSWLLARPAQTAPLSPSPSPPPAPLAKSPLAKVTLEQLFRQQEQEQEAERRAKRQAARAPSRPADGAVAFLPESENEAEPGDALERSGASARSYGSYGGDAAEFDAMMQLSAPLHPLQQRRARAALIWLAAAAVLFLANQLTMLPVGFYPGYARDRLGLAPWAVNLFFSLYPLCIMVCSPLAAAATPIIGRQSLVCLGLVLSGASTIAFAYVGSVASVFVLRVLQGIGAGAAVVGATAVLTEEFSASVAQILVVQEFVVAAAFVSAPPIGSYLFDCYGFKMPFLASGAAQLLVVVLIPFLFIEYSLPDGLYVHGHTSRLVRRASSFREAKGYHEVLTPTCIVCLGITTFAMASFGFIDPFLGAHLQTTLGAPRLVVGFGFAVNALVYFLGGLAYMFLSRQFGCRQVVLVGLAQLALGFLLLGPAPFLRPLLWSGGALWAAQSVALVLIGCGSALAIAPGLPLTLLSLCAPGSRALNLVVGLFSAAIYLGQALGPVLSLFLASALPPTRAPGCASDACGSPLPWTFAAYALLALAVLAAVACALPRGELSAGAGAGAGAGSGSGSPPGKRQASQRRLPLARQPSEYGQYVFFDEDECDADDF